MAIGCKSVLPPGSMPLNFRVEGIEPVKDTDWARATPLERMEFWKIAGIYAMEVKQRELSRGLDYAGRKLKPVKLRKARYASGARLDGDPLTPHRALSRTRRLLRFAVTSAGVTMYWAMGWGKILDYHRRGSCIVRDGVAVGRLPVRNVFGISPKGRHEIATRALTAWKSGVKPKTKDPLMAANGMAIDLPIDPIRGIGLDPDRFLAPGVRRFRYQAQTRTVNPETGIPGGTSPGNIYVNTDLRKRKWAK